MLFVLLGGGPRAGNNMQEGSMALERGEEKWRKESMSPFSALGIYPNCFDDRRMRRCSGRYSLRSFEAAAAARTIHFVMVVVCGIAWLVVVVVAHERLDPFTDDGKVSKSWLVVTAKHPPLPGTERVASSCGGAGRQCHKLYGDRRHVLRCGCC
jgi:hypothetical protein